MAFPKESVEAMTKALGISIRSPAALFALPFYSRTVCSSLSFIYIQHLSGSDHLPFLAFWHLPGEGLSTAYITRLSTTSHFTILFLLFVYPHSTWTSSNSFTAATNQLLVASLAWKLAAASLSAESLIWQGMLAFTPMTGSSALFRIHNVN